MDDIRLSVGQATTPMVTFAEDLRVYAMAGAEGIGIDAALKICDLRAIPPSEPRNAEVRTTGRYAGDGQARPGKPSSHVQGSRG